MRPWFILLLIAIVALEYYIPVKERFIPQEQLAFMDWLAKEDDEQIRLVNLPMGRTNSKYYNLYQSISGYPHAEGAISRTPDEAFDYIRANFILNHWHANSVIQCAIDTKDDYLLSLDQLEADGFTHVNLHLQVGHPALISDSFQNAVPSYADEWISIFRIDDLRASCP